MSEEIGCKSSPHHFHIHTYGHHTEFTFHIKVNGQMTVEAAHQLASRIDRRIMKEMDIYATIHVEPLD